MRGLGFKPIWVAPQEPEIAPIPVWTKITRSLFLTRSADLTNAEYKRYQGEAKNGVEAVIDASCPKEQRNCCVILCDGGVFLWMMTGGAGHVL